MRVVNGFSDELDVTRCFSGRQRTVAHELGEVLSLDVIHREVMLVVMDAYVVNGDDVRMLEESRSRDLPPEPLNHLLARELPGQNHFQRHDAPKASLPGAIDHAHPAAGNLFEQFVVAEVPNRPTFDVRCLILAFCQERLRLARGGDFRFR